MENKFLNINKEKKIIKPYLNFDKNKLNYLAINNNALGLINKNLSKLNNLNWEYLTNNKNPKVFYILSKNLDKLTLNCWYHLCFNSNDNIVSLLINNIDKLNTICWDVLCLNQNLKIIDIISNELKKSFNITYLQNLCKNKNAIHVIREYKHKIDDICITKLCFNENAFDLLKEIIDFNNFNSIKPIYIHNLCLNRNKDIIQYLFDNFNNLNRHLFINICLNPAATSLIEKYYDENESWNNDTLCLNYLCYNENPAIIPIIVKNLQYLTEFSDLCINENAIDVINNNIKKISMQGWINLSKNINAIKIIKTNFNCIKYCFNNFNFINNLLSNPSIFRTKKLFII